ncbi:MAG: helix-turn-helix transcriptional regulator [Clostridia bacterium]|nr:helix-turn-helix transcriptional regulator [Clostridia bacterium]
MTITDAMKKKHMTKAELCRKSGVAWATLSDICAGRTALSRVSVATAIRIADALGETVESLFRESKSHTGEDSFSFERFKGTTCHRLRRLGDIDFMIEVIESKEIRSLYQKRRLAQAFYLVAMIDYLCRRNNIPLCKDYDDIRGGRLAKPLYPSYAMIPYLRNKDTSAMRRCRREAIPEFLHFNIIEGDIDNVV